MLNLSLNKLKLIAKNRDIKDYKRMSKNKSLKILKETKPIKINKTTTEKKKKILMQIKCLKAQTAYQG